RGARVHVVLPHDKESFLKTSVDVIKGANWRKRFHEVLRRATHETIASEIPAEKPGGSHYEYANRVALGLAMIRARHLASHLMGMAVWDGKAGDGTGGTKWTIDLWEQANVPVQRIDLMQLLRRHTPELASESAPARPPSGDEHQVPKVRGLLFADAAGFSK